MVRQIGENPKVCVYAICKNEEKFIPRWVESLKEADYIVVLDTGSTDNSVAVLEGYSPLVHVEQKVYDDFRFDVARNDAMKLIPEDADICVVSDLDHVFRPGWKNILVNAFKEGVDEVYGPIIDYDENKNVKKWFLSKNVHPNDKRWYWERPIHEGVYYHDDPNDHKEMVGRTINEFVIEHHQDFNKDRGFYLDMLRKEYEEGDNRKDPFCMIYYGCELSFHDKPKEAMDVFLKGYCECDFSNTPEIHYQTCINIALSYQDLGLYDYALKFAHESFKYGIKKRRNIMLVANLLKQKGDYTKAQRFMRLAFKEVPILDESWVETKDYFNGLIYKELGDLYKDHVDNSSGLVIDYYTLYDNEKGNENHKDEIDNLLLKFIEDEFSNLGGGYHE